jgi:hypothetical protein
LAGTTDRDLIQINLISLRRGDAVLQHGYGKNDSHAHGGARRANSFLEQAYSGDAWEMASAARRPLHRGG